ncbi:hypothetical protein KP803_10435 [Vibrio sp. ZSDE26]|uniref:Uncharacterized protein n=1 Tax=Vibrio amylolyticus TaxID=2847292 RepID=A0A9X2BHD3_9VIBR|nr:hypothetical protein [Vibrio amylolyticus]MCK6263689.1 hypothetical protein [Vibrio amylolyticus]
MTINKYFVFVPRDVENQSHNEQNNSSKRESQRQAMVQSAQKEGGL